MTVRCLMLFGTYVGCCCYSNDDY